MEKSFTAKFQIVFPIFLLAFFLSSFSVRSQTKLNEIEAFLETWDNSEGFLIEIAERMPFDQYHYKPTEDQFTFDQHLHHIYIHLHWIASAYFLEVDNPVGEEYKYSKKPKEQRIMDLQSAFQYVRSAVNSLQPEDLFKYYHFRPAKKEISRRRLLHLLLDHTTHHRGELIVYLRLNHIDAPRYVGW